MQRKLRRNTGLYKRSETISTKLPKMLFPSSYHWLWSLQGLKLSICWKNKNSNCYQPQGLDCIFSNLKSSSFFIYKLLMKFFFFLKLSSLLLGRFVHINVNEIKIGCSCGTFGPFVESSTWNRGLKLVVAFSDNSIFWPPIHYLL